MSAQTKRPRPRFAILASGHGSNAEVLMDAFADGSICATLGLILSNRPEARVLSKAAERGYLSELVPSHGPGSFADRSAHETAILNRLQAHRIEHLLLAGYQRLLSPHFLRQFSGHILNIHPSLLPEFPGLYAVERQFAAKVPVCGATVHLVDEGIDTGPVLLQGAIARNGQEDGVKGLRQRIKREVEHVIYPRAVRLLLQTLLEQPVDAGSL